MSQSKNTVSKCLVVDASVALKAGGIGSPKPTSKPCRDLLEGILRLPHTLAWSAAIKKEWDDHSAGFARKWRVQMVARRRLKPIEGKLVPGMEERALSSTPNAKAKAAMQKDLHLIYAALEAAHLIISLDEVVRKLFIAAGPKVIEMSKIGWLNPDQPANVDVSAWLEAGCPVRNVALLP